MCIANSPIHYEIRISASRTGLQAGWRRAGCRWAMGVTRACLMRHAGNRLVWKALLVGQPLLDLGCDERLEVGVVIVEHHADGVVRSPDRQRVAITGE